MAAPCLQRTSRDFKFRPLLSRSPVSSACESHDVSKLRVNPMHPSVRTCMYAIDRLFLSGIWCEYTLLVRRCFCETERHRKNLGLASVPLQCVVVVVVVIVAVVAVLVVVTVVFVVVLVAVALRCVS